MDDTKKKLLDAKLAELKKQQGQTRIEAEKKRIITSVDDFASKYRFAREDETARIQSFIGKLEFEFPAHIKTPSVKDNSRHEDMYLSFLCGSGELLGIYICGKYDDLISDLDSWNFFSPYLLLMDQDFIGYIYIDDNGNITESSL